MKVLLLYVPLLILMLHLFTVDVVWVGYISQTLYWSAILTLILYLWTYRSEYKNLHTITALLVIVYIIFLSSWSIFFFKHSISPDVIYEHQIVENIIASGRVGSPDTYYFAARLYAEWPLLEIMVAIFSITTDTGSLIVMKYLWIVFKILLVVGSLVFFKEMLKAEFRDEIAQESLSEIALYSVVIFLASSSSIYFFSFTVKSLLSITYVVLYFVLIYKGNATTAIILGFAMGLSHNATVYVLAISAVLWLITATVIRSSARGPMRKALYKTLISTATILIAIILWKAQMNLQNIVRCVIEAFMFLEQPQIERGLRASISPIKPLIYKVLGYLGEFVLISLFVMNIKKVIYRFLESLNGKTPLSLLMLFCLTYVFAIVTMSFIVGRGVDIIVRLVFYLNFIMAPYVSLLLLKLKNSYVKLHKVVLLIVLVLFLVTGIYGIVPPSVYDKNVAWSMDDPRFFLHYGNSLWHVGDYIISRKLSYPIFSIALGYYFLGGRGIPYTRLCEIENYEGTALILLRRSIEWLSDYCGITLNLDILYKESSVVYHSGEIFLILKQQ